MGPSPMIRLAVIAAAAAITVYAGTLAGQQVNFSGVWTRVEQDSVRPPVAATGDAAFRTGTMGSGWGSPLTLRHEGSRLAVEFRFFSNYDLQPPLRFVYALDGSESRNSVMIGHARSDQRSRAEWRGDTLVITTRYPAPDLGDSRASAEVRQSLVLQSPDTLLVETSRQGAPVMARTRYIKS